MNEGPSSGLPRTEWEALRAGELNALAKENAIVILPVGSIEQHGPHLPTSVDVTLVSNIARRAATIVADHQKIVVGPTMPFGLAEHHVEFGGTISLNFDTFRSMIHCVVRSTIRCGFRRIFILNGHGGNTFALNVITSELSKEFKLPIFMATYWQIVGDEFRGILENQSTVRHACEAETSMMLAIAPEHVEISMLTEAIGPSSLELSDIVGDGVYLWRSFAARTVSGTIGNASLATSEKGSKLLEAVAHRLAEILLKEEIWDLPISRPA